jgi:hypothetical protein
MEPDYSQVTPEEAEMLRRVAEARDRCPDYQAAKRRERAERAKAEADGLARIEESTRRAGLQPPLASVVYTDEDLTNPN